MNLVLHKCHQRRNYNDNMTIFAVKNVKHRWQSRVAQRLTTTSWKHDKYIAAINKGSNSCLLVIKQRSQNLYRLAAMLPLLRSTLYFRTAIPQEFHQCYVSSSFNLIGPPTFWRREQVRYGEFARPISQSGASMRKWVWLARLPGSHCSISLLPSTVLYSRQG